MKNLITILLTFSLFTLFAQEKDVGDTTVVELITFESESDYFVQSTATTNIWQVGQPSKSNFSEAYSGLNAVVTDTLNSYPPNNHSWFDIMLTSDNYNWYSYFHGISFYQKLNTDTLLDGGYISVSYDLGESWKNIIYDSNYFSGYSNPLYWSITPVDKWNTTNLYSNDEKLFNDEPGFSGVIDNWEYVAFSWWVEPVKNYDDWTDTVLIRFNFISDATETAKDGWIIDDLSIFWVDVGSNIHEKPLVANLEVFPNPIVNFATIRSKNQQEVLHYELFNILGEKLQQKTVNNSEFTFEKENLDSGVYLIKCYYNDRKTESIRIQVN